MSLEKKKKQEHADSPSAMLDAAPAFELHSNGDVLASTAAVTGTYYY